MKTCTWDIETTNLDADVAVVLSAVVKPFGGKPVVFRKSKSGSNDKDIVIAMRDELEKYDIIVGYYHLNFDLPFLNSRLLYWGQRPLQRKMHVDVYRLARKIFKIHSRRLASVCSFLKIDGKSSVDINLWMKAALDGDKKAMDWIVEHNVYDCITLEKVFDRLKYSIISISSV
jgi:uncharacterized protein YprB with RNaseH-like and TPR domain